jgi:hypothetical protein
MAECGLFETLGRWWFLMPKRVASAPARADPARPRSKSPDHVGEWQPPFNLRTGRLLTRERQPETRVARRILAFEPVPIGEFKALVKGDGGLIVYRPGGGIAPVTVPWRGFGALGFDPESGVPLRSTPFRHPNPPNSLALWSFPSIQLTEAFRAGA